MIQHPISIFTSCSLTTPLSGSSSHIMLIHAASVRRLCSSQTRHFTNQGAKARAATFVEGEDSHLLNGLALASRFLTYALSSC